MNEKIRNLLILSFKNLLPKNSTGKKLPSFSSNRFQGPSPSVRSMGTGKTRKKKERSGPVICVAILWPRYLKFERGSRAGNERYLDTRRKLFVNREVRLQSS